MTVAPISEPAEETAPTREDEIRHKVEEYLAAYEARDVDRLLALFADDAEVTVAPGTFRGDAIRKLYEWDAELSPTALVRDSGIGVVVSGRTAVCEHAISLTYRGTHYEEQAAKVFEFDGAAKIRRLHSYYDKLGVLEQIAAGYPGIQGRVFRLLIGYLVAQGRKGLDVPTR